MLTLLGADAATASLLAVIPLTILTRVFAITQKTPVTVFLLTGIFPLVPGAGIYYTAYYFIQNENTLALANGISTFKIAVALAIGISLVLCAAEEKVRPSQSSRLANAVSLRGFAKPQALTEAVARCRRSGRTRVQPLYTSFR